MVRVVLGGTGLSDFEAVEFTDHYIKLLFPAPGATYVHPVDVEAAQATNAREHWPVTRTYTVRAWDSEQRALTVDVVLHGDEGIAGPWAATARPGDRISFFGPGGAYAPDAAADWHLFVGDESALPAIAAGLERVPASAQAFAFVEVEDEQEEQPLPSPARLQVRWLHRQASNDSDQLVRAVREAELPSGTVHAFVHGEAGFVRDIRRHLRAERGVPLAALSASGYWRRGRTDEAWRAEKKDWKAAVDLDDASLS
jgi:NADPH-dependent ferric siderophore reductase